MHIAPCIIFNARLCLEIDLILFNLIIFKALARIGFKNSSSHERAAERTAAGRTVNLCLIKIPDAKLFTGSDLFREGFLGR